MDDIYKTGNELAWLDEVAKTAGRHSAIDIAKTNASQPWAREWIVTRAHAAEVPAEIVKAAENAYETALAAFDQAQAHFEKSHGIAAGRGINRFMEEAPEARDLYRKFALEHETVRALHRAGRGG